MKAYQILSSFAIAGALFASNASAEPSVALAPMGAWTLKYSWSGASACTSGSATYSAVGINFAGGPTTGTFTIPTQGLSGTWASIGSEFALLFSSGSAAYGGDVLGKMGVGMNFNGSSAGCWFMYPGTAPAMVDVAAIFTADGTKK